MLDMSRPSRAQRAAMASSVGSPGFRTPPTPPTTRLVDRPASDTDGYCVAFALALLEQTRSPLTFASLVDGYATLLGRHQ